MLLGQEKRFKYIAIHELHHRLGARKAITLPFFHASTSCDTVSYFHSKGKKTCWKIWNLLDEATTSFEALLKNPMTFEAHMPTIEHLLCCCMTGQVQTWMLMLPKEFYLHRKEEK